MFLQSHHQNVGINYSMTNDQLSDEGIFSTSAQYGQTIESRTQVIRLQLLHWMANTRKGLASTNHVHYTVNPDVDTVAKMLSLEISPTNQTAHGIICAAFLRKPYGSIVDTSNITSITGELIQCPNECILVNDIVSPNQHNR
jgi:hypothetical protein